MIHAFSVTGPLPSHPWCCIALRWLVTLMAVPLAAASLASELDSRILHSRLPNHPNHFSSAEVRWNEKNGKFEVALRVWPADLEKALSNISGRSVDLEKTNGLNKLIAAYVSGKFLILKVPAEQPPNPNSEDSPPNADAPLDLSSERLSAANDSAPGDGKWKETAHPELDHAQSEFDRTNDHEAGDLEGRSGDYHSSTTNRHSQDLASKSQPASEPETAKAEQPQPRQQKLPERFRWVGFETNPKEAWLYFELAGDLEPATWQIENRVFFEFNEEQVNQIRFSDGKQTRSYSLKINQPTWEFQTFRTDRRQLDNSRSKN
jgi:hypothetical protein